MVKGVPYSDILELATGELSVAEMGRRLDVSHQNVSQRLQRHGDYKDYLARRSDIKRKEKELPVRRRELLGVIAMHCIERSNPLDVKAAERFREQMPHLTTSFEKVMELYRLDRVAYEQGEQLRQVDLAEKTGISQSQVSKIFSLSPPSYSRRKRRIVPEWKKEAVIRSRELDLLTIDVAELLNLKPPTVRRIRGNVGNPKPLAVDAERKYLQYHQATNIYYCLDGGLSVEETADLVGVTIPRVEIAIKKARYLRPKVTRRLRVLFDRPELTTPYIQ